MRYQLTDNTILFKGTKKEVREAQEWLIQQFGEDAKLIDVIKKLSYLKNK
ncbi:MAG: hypothetical protein KGI27_13405 [Thaumarchaeota archaeon]|nr:hypothetical protein [Nitrososphaerota archaeon]